MMGYDLEVLFKKNPDLLLKKQNRYTIRSLLKSLTPEELGELMTDCGDEFLEESKANLALQIENILKLLRRNR